MTHSHTNSPLGIVFVHGWGFDASFFDPLANELTRLLGGHPQCRWDRGYFEEDAFHEDLPTGRWIGVGHSLGFHRLLGLPLEGFVSLAGFTRFCALADESSGTSLSVLQLMISGFKKHPQAVLAAFDYRCGVSWAIIHKASIHSDRLLEDLMSMKTLNVIPSLVDYKKPLLVLTDRDDKIVSQNLLEDNFKDFKQVTWEIGEGGGHVFPYSSASWCAQKIKEWMVKCGGI